MTVSNVRWCVDQLSSTLGKGLEWGKIMRRLQFIVALSVAFIAGMVFDVGAASAAYRFCQQPMAPSIYLRKPTKPYCAISRTCSEWEVSNYRSELDKYFRKLRSYAEEVDNYYSNATDYVACMSKLD